MSDFYKTKQVIKNLEYYANKETLTTEEINEYMRLCQENENIDPTSDVKQTTKTDYSELANWVVDNFDQAYTNLKDNTNK